VSPSAAPAASSLEQAEATRDALRGKLDDARLSLAALDEARKEYGFEAHTIGGEAAKRLAKMNKDRLAILGDIETLEEDSLCALMIRKMRSTSCSSFRISNKARLITRSRGSIPRQPSGRTCFTVSSILSPISSFWLRLL
jgi:hypothetical protein